MKWDVNERKKGRHNAFYVYWPTFFEQVWRLKFPIGIIFCVFVIFSFTFSLSQFLLLFSLSNINSYIICAFFTMPLPSYICGIDFWLLIWKVAYFSILSNKYKEWRMRSSKDDEKNIVESDIRSQATENVIEISSRRGGERMRLRLTYRAYYQFFTRCWCHTYNRYEKLNFIHTFPNTTVIKGIDLHFSHTIFQ